MPTHQHDQRSGEKASLKSASASLDLDFQQELDVPVRRTPEVTPANALTLQRMIGNRAVSRMLEQQRGSAPKPVSHISSPAPAAPPSHAKTTVIQRKPLKTPSISKPSIQRWPFDQDGNDLGMGMGGAFDKFNTIGGGIHGAKNYGIEKATGMKLPGFMGNFFKGADVLNTGNKFRTQGVTEDSVGSGLSTALNFVPGLGPFNVGRGFVDAGLEAGGYGKYTSGALMGKGVNHMANSYAKLPPEIRDDIMHPLNPMSSFHM